VAIGAHVVVIPGVDLSKRAMRSPNVSCANCGSSLTSILYFETISVRIAIPSVSKNLDKGS